MFKIRPFAAAAAAAFAVTLAAAPPARAALVTSSYSGTVTDHLFLPRVLLDHPLGTSVAWEFTFDDAFRLLDAAGLSAQGGVDQSITGWLQVGADRYTLDRLWMYAFTYNGGTNEIISYRPQIMGSGPSTSDDGELFGIFLSLTPDFQMSNVAVGYGYTYPGGIAYGYLVTEGSGSIVPAQQVPVPATAWLVLPALAWLVRARRA